MVPPALSSSAAGSSLLDVTESKSCDVAGDGSRRIGRTLPANQRHLVVIDPYEAEHVGVICHCPDDYLPCAEHLARAGLDEVSAMMKGLAVKLLISLTVGA